MVKGHLNRLERLGGWVTDSIDLGFGLSTAAPRGFHRALRVKRVIQLVQDLVFKPLHELHLIDLGSGEGGHAIELALHRAKVLCVEARQPSVDKIKFVKNFLGLKGLSLLQADVRHLSGMRLGTFDTVLCLGVLYHLDAPDCFQLVEYLYQATSRFVVIDTHIGLRLNQATSYGSLRVKGWRFQEHAEDDSKEVRLSRSRSSLDNTYSLWMSRDSLRKVLYRVGFTTVLEYWPPRRAEEIPDRLILVAIKGENISYRSLPQLNDLPEADPKHAVLREGMILFNRRVGGWMNFIRTRLKRCLRFSRRFPWKRGS